MARIRSVKPELRTSRVVASWPFEMRYFWVLLWGYLDDKGRGRDLPKQIAGDCFPHDDKVTPSRVETWLTTMTLDVRGAKKGPLCRYEVDGVRYLHAVNFNEHNSINRPTPSRLPPCPFHEPLTESVDDLFSEGLNGDSMSGAEEQRSRGTEEQKHSRRPELFAEFYAAYPRKVGRGEAEKAWRKAVKHAAPQAIINAAKRYAASRHGQDSKFTPYPATWLNQKRWEDEPETPHLRAVGDYRPYRDPQDQSAYDQEF